MSKHRIIVGDCLDGLATLGDQSIQTCVTSPPYFGLRDYGHDGQIGLEGTPDAFVDKMVEVFRSVRRVLRDDGTLWLNLGDTFATGTTAANSQSKNPGVGANNPNAQNSVPRVGTPDGLKTKDLIGIPWRVAFALQADGWYLRQDIIWHKPNPMPESVTDRCTKAHEYIFLLTKSPRYYYDHEAIKEEGSGSSGGSCFGKQSQSVEGTKAQSRQYERPEYSGRNKRSVWSVTTRGFKGAHFAVFPEDLIVPCVLAGCPEGGVVLDPFTGSGTTGVVACTHGRDFVGCELNPEYATIARDRIGKAVNPSTYRNESPDESPLFTGATQ